MSDWFDEFYDEALPVVFGYFVRRCGGRVGLAEELTQETFLSAIRSLDRGAQVTAPMPWVVSIARRRLVDHYRSERRRRESQETLGARHEGSPRATQSTTTLAEARLLSALDQVDRDQRLALILRYVDDLPLKEVAHLVGRTESATESLLRRGRETLRNAYEKTRDV